MSTTGVNLTSMGLNSSTVSSGNGLDVTAVVNQILDSERGPEQLWQQRQSTLRVQTSTLNSLNSSLNALKTAAQALTDATGIVTSNVATSSQTGILTASAQSSAAAGSHRITVTSLATTASAYTDGVSDSNTTFQGGTLTIQVGTTSTDITVDSSNNTLSQLADTINAPQIGVRASVISDATGAHLALVSQTSGKPGDLTITGNTTGLVFHKASSGDNASLTIDGVPISSATNTVTGAIPGVTLNLVSSAPTSSVELTVGPDTSGIRQAVSAFVSAYNSVISAINGQYLVGSDGSAGVLAANSSLRSLQSSLLSDITYAMSDNNGYNSLRSLGITMANDGTLSLDSATLNDVLSSHYTEFQNFFQGVDTSFGAQLANDLTTLTSPTQGILNATLTEISSEQKILTDSINDFEDRLAARQQQLIKEYSQIDAMLRNYPLQLQQITSQLNSLNSMQSQK
jgi:flagellar hook-associated protein 2